MLKGDNINTQEVHGLDNFDLEKIKCYLKGAIYCWCKNTNPERKEWFTASSLVLGGENFHWQETPMFILYQRQLDARKSSDEAFTQAAIDAGRILKKVLFDDQRRTFETKKEYVRSYRWIGDDNIE